MSCDCSNTDVTTSSTMDHDVSSIVLAINLFLIGISSSFSHCIAMCGSIAVSQATMRLIQLNQSKVNTPNKILCCISWPYYLGKTITYCLLTFLAMLFGYVFRNNVFFIILKNILLLIVAFYFILSAIQTIYRLLGVVHNKPSKHSNNNNGFLTNLMERASQRYNLIINRSYRSANLNGVSGLMIGMLLGLIPCGVVYGSIVTIVSHSQNSLLTAMTAMLSFGIGTFPGLFLLAYSGNLFFYRFRKVFDMLYACTMLWNAKMLVFLL